METEKKKKTQFGMGKSSMEAAQHANSKGSPSLPFAIVHFLGDEVPHSGNSAGTFCSGNRVMGVQHCPMSMLLTTNSNHIRLTSGRVDYPFQRILQNDQKKTLSSSQHGNSIYCVRTIQ